MEKIKIIKLGGSLVSILDEVGRVQFNFDYVKNLKEVLENRIENGEKFCIVVGGGQLSRINQKAARENGVDKVIDLHWIGTTACVFNAEMVRAMFGELAENRPVVYEDIKKESIKFEKPILIAGAFRAGTSSDMSTVQLAEKLNIKEIITLKDVDYLYTADPDKDPEAKIVKEATWDEYFKIINFVEDHSPGGSFIVDPISARKAKDMGLKFTVINGSNIENFANLLNNQKFIGSAIM